MGKGGKRMKVLEETRLLRLAGIVILAGLVLQLITFVWFHPITFMLHLSLGGFTTLVAVVLYFVHLFHHR